MDYDHILDHLPPMKKVAMTNGGEYHGSCPMCGGRDRFVVWATNGRWMCRQCNPGGGDAVELMNRWHGDSYLQALARLGIVQGGTVSSRAGKTVSIQHTVRMRDEFGDDKLCWQYEWQEWAKNLTEAAFTTLWTSDMGASARQYLSDRALDLAVCERAGLGLLTKPQEKVIAGKKCYAHRGISIPWMDSDLIWRVNVRRRQQDVESGGNKYHEITGGTNGFYVPSHDNRIRHGRECMALVLTESELDALSIMSMIERHPRRGELQRQLIAAATGGTTRARLMRWIAKAATADLILVAFDNDENGAGDAGAKWWLSALGDKAFRLKPWRKDVNDMLRIDGDAQVFEWLRSYRGTE